VLGSWDGDLKGLALRRCLAAGQVSWHPIVAFWSRAVRLLYPWEAVGCFVCWFLVRRRNHMLLLFSGVYRPWFLDYLGLGWRTKYSMGQFQLLFFVTQN